VPRVRALFLASALTAAALSSGCLVLSLQPVYDSSAIESEESLVGIWENPDDHSSFVVDQGEWKSYRITYSAAAGAAPLALVGYLTKIGDELYLDVTPPRGVEVDWLLVPAHAACKLQLSSDRLAVTGLDYDWFIDAVSRHALPGLLAVLDGRKDVVIVSDSAAVRRWLLGHARAEAVFAETVTFVRKK